jgi:flagellum-specific peptidoglycan hydrolase FlgJ
MTKTEFIKAFYPYALQSQKKTGISALANLAQAAVESGWGKVCPGNMLFGVKDTDGINGNEQLLTTTEYSRSANAKFPRIISVKPVLLKGQKFFKYTIKDYFRKYVTPEECFTDHANFFLKNPRYAKAMLVKSDPYKFIDEIAKAGYATDPNYATSLKSIAKNLEKLILQKPIK